MAINSQSPLSKLTGWLLPTRDDTRLSARAYGFLMLLCLVMMGSGLTSIPVMDRDEARYAQASRQMIETGDFVDIRFQDDARHVKPAGVYWMQTASASMFGGADAPITAYRLPSLLAAIAAVLGTAWIGARFGGASVGFTAALLLAASILMQIEARTAKTDAALLATAVMAQASLFLLFRAGDGRKQKFIGPPALFWAAQGLALMVKGPIVAMVSATTIIALFFFAKSRAWLKHLHTLKGVALTALIALPWVIAITINSGGGFLEDSLGHALFGKVGKADDSHGGPPGYHLVLFYGVFWPGALLAGLITAFAWRKRAHDDIVFLLAWILPSWLLFELIGTKLPHYVLPLYPAIAILGGLAVRHAPDLLQSVWARRLHWAAVATFVILGFVAASLAPLGAVQLNGKLSVAAIAACIAGLMTVGFGVWLAGKPEAQRAIPLAASVTLFYICFFGFAAPSFTPLWPSQEISKIVATLDGCEDITVVTAGYREPSNVFYNGTKTYLAATGRDAAQFLAQNSHCGVAFVDAAERQSFDAALSAAGLNVREVGAVSGINTVKNDKLDMLGFVAVRSRFQPGI